MRPCWTTVLLCFMQICKGDRAAPCRLISSRSYANVSRQENQWVPLEVKGKKFHYKERSVVVLCSNVSAHDIQHLIPKCDGANAGKGPCMRLAAEKTQLAREADKCDGRECANNDEDLCRDGDEMNCKLLRKIKDYLRKQFLLATSKQWKNATKKKVSRTKKKTNVATPPQPFLLVALLPCKEEDEVWRTKRWLRQLQRHLRLTSSTNDTSSILPPNAKTIALLSCRASRSLLASISPAHILGILSFESASGAAGHPGRVTESYGDFCNRRANAIDRMLRFREDLAANSFSGRDIDLVYTYSRGNAPTMRLLAQLVASRQIQLDSAVPHDARGDRPFPPPRPGRTTLYLGGPVSASCESVSAASALKSALSQWSSLSKKKHQVPARVMAERDCGCRDWGYQFLTFDEPQVTVTYTTSKSVRLTASSTTTTTTSTTTTSTTTTSTTTTTTAATQTTTTTAATRTMIATTTKKRPSTTNAIKTTAETTVTTTTTATSVSRKSSTGATTTVISSRNLFSWASPTTAAEKDQNATSATFQVDDHVEVQSDSPLLLPQNSSCRRQTWQLLSLGLSVTGVSGLAVTMATYAVMLVKTHRAFHFFELLLPAGLILLYLSLAAFGVSPKGAAVFVVCLLRRCLPGLGFAAAFSGVVVQLLHELNKNVYTVNSSRHRHHHHEAVCSFSSCFAPTRQEALFLLGLALVAIQGILSAVWLIFAPPPSNVNARYVCGCPQMSDFQKTFFFTLSYPVFLGVAACALSALSIKWRTNSGAASSNLCALLCTFASWSAMAALATATAKQQQQGHVSPK